MLHSYDDSKIKQTGFIVFSDRKKVWQDKSIDAPLYFIILIKILNKTEEKNQRHLYISK